MTDGETRACKKGHNGGKFLLNSVQAFRRSKTPPRIARGAKKGKKGSQPRRSNSRRYASGGNKYLDVVWGGRERNRGAEARIKKTRIKSEISWWGDLLDTGVKRGSQADKKDKTRATLGRGLRRKHLRGRRRSAGNTRRRPQAQENRCKGKCRLRGGRQLLRGEKEDRRRREGSTAAKGGKLLRA